MFLNSTLEIINNTRRRCICFVLAISTHFGHTAPCCLTWTYASTFAETTTNTRHWRRRQKNPSGRLNLDCLGMRLLQNWLQTTYLLYIRKMQAIVLINCCLQFCLFLTPFFEISKGENGYEFQKCQRSSPLSSSKNHQTWKKCRTSLKLQSEKCRSSKPNSHQLEWVSALSCWSFKSDHSIQLSGRLREILIYLSQMSVQNDTRKNSHTQLLHTHTHTCAAASAGCCGRRRRRWGSTSWPLATNTTRAHSSNRHSPIFASTPEQ